MRSLRILVIEDIRTDFLLLERHLLQNGLRAHCECVDRPAALQRALEKHPWDMVLADYNVPGLPFEASLTAIRTRRPDVPVILVSGSVGEERAVALLKQGVADFILKDNLVRLVSSIERALQEANEKRARLAAEAALRDNDLRLRLAVDAARAGSWEWDVRTQRVVWSDEIWALYGLPPYSCEPTYTAWADTIHPDDRAATEAAVCQAASDGVEFEIEWQVHTDTAAPRWLMARGRPLRDAAGQLERYLGIVMDVTRARQARFALENHAKLLEREVAARTAELGAAKAELQQRYVELQEAQRLAQVGIVNASAVYDPAGRFLRSRSSIVDITERKCLEEVWGRLSVQPTDLSRHLVLVQEEERRRLTTLIDDVLSPNLCAAQLTLRDIAAHIPATAQRQMDTQLEDVRALVEDAVTNLRGLSAELRPAVLDYAGLHAAVESYAAQFSARTGLPVSIRGYEPKARWPHTVESCLFRIVQEALANCWHHSGAQQVGIELDQDGPLLSLVISDDGIGFVPGDVHDLETTSHIGLVTMQARAEFAGGRFSLETNPGGGTRIHVVVAVSGAPNS